MISAACKNIFVNVLTLWDPDFFPVLAVFIKYKIEKNSDFYLEWLSHLIDCMHKKMARICFCITYCVKRSVKAFSSVLLICHMFYK